MQVLVATDAAGEGVNLQVANLMVNYDLPWNPNRIEQRFGRIHRIGQTAAVSPVEPRRPRDPGRQGVRAAVREDRAATRRVRRPGLRRARRLQHQHVAAGAADRERSARTRNPSGSRCMDEVIDGDIGRQLDEVLRERALVAGLGGEASTDEIRELMERAKARTAAARVRRVVLPSGARSSTADGSPAARLDRFEITRVPASIRTHADRSHGHVHDRYSRVTFDKRAIQPDGMERAELVAPGTPLLTAVVDKVLADHGRHPRPRRHCS